MGIGIATGENRAAEAAKKPFPVRFLKQQLMARKAS